MKISANIKLFACLLVIASCTTSEPKVNAVDMYTGGYKPPVCPDWSKVSGVNYANNKSSNYGCSTINNYGAMIEDKRDMIVGKSGQPSAARTAAGITAYKSGQPITTTTASE